MIKSKGKKVKNTARQEMLPGELKTHRLLIKYSDMRRFLKRAETLGDARGGDSQIIEDIRASAANTAAVVNMLDQAMTEAEQEFKTRCEEYRFNAFKWHYIEELGYEQIGEMLNCGKNSPARWCREVLAVVAVKMYGVDGVRK